MKKFLSFTIALAFMLSVASCSKTEGENSKSNEPKQSFTAEKMSVAAYKKEAIPMPENMQMVYSVMPFNNGADYLMLGTSTRTPEIWKVKGDFSESEIIEYPEFDIGVNYNLTALNDGTIVLFVIHADYGDLPPIPLYEYPTPEEQEKYDEAAEYSFMIKTYSPDGKLQSEVTIEDFDVIPEKETSIQGVYSDGEIVIAEIGGGFEMFDFNGKYLGEFKTESGEVDCFGQDNQGNLICALKNEVEEKEILTFCKVENDGSLSEINNTEYEFDETVYEMQASSGDYSLLLRTNSQIYGVKSDTQEIVSLFDIFSSGYNTNLIIGYRVLSDGNVGLLINDSTTWKVQMKKFIPRTEEELANLKTITIGIEGNSFVENEILEWNDSGQDFFVEVVRYDNSWENSEAVFDQMREDALSGNLPDIIFFESDYTEMCGINLGEMGVLEDLYTYMDKDDTFNRDYFIPHVLSYYEDDGELTALPSRVILSLGTVAKTKFVGDGSDWSLEKKLDMAIDPPNNAEIMRDSKYTRLGLGGLNFTDWIDYTDGSCHFTDESFIRYLKFCNEAEEIEYVYEQQTAEDWEQYYLSEEAQAEENKHYIAYIDDLKIFSQEELCNYSDYTKLTKGKFGGDEIIPLEDVKYRAWDCLAITKSSENKELAWEFIKSRMTDEHYSKDIRFNPFPVTKSAYKMHGDFHLYDVYEDYSDPYFDEDLRGYEGLLYQMGDTNKKIGKVTEEDAEAVDRFFNNTVKNNEVRFSEFKMYEIFQEEINVFFNGGYTAEKCAEILQDRIGTYISEQIS